MQQTLKNAIASHRDFLSLKAMIYFLFEHECIQHDLDLHESCKHAVDSVVKLLYQSQLQSVNANPLNLESLSALSHLADK